MLADVPGRLFVGGRWQTSRDGGTMPVEDPATGGTLMRVADATEADALAALDAACAAQAEWKLTPPRQRAEILRRAYEAVTTDIDELSLLNTLEMGKPLSEARAEVTYAAHFFHWFHGEATRLEAICRTARATLATRLALYLLDVADLQAANQAFADVLGDTRPARSTLVAAPLMGGARAGVDAIVALD